MFRFVQISAVFAVVLVTMGCEYTSPPLNGQRPAVICTGVEGDNDLDFEQEPGWRGSYSPQLALRGEVAVELTELDTGAIWYLVLDGLEPEFDIDCTGTLTYGTEVDQAFGRSGEFEDSEAWYQGSTSAIGASTSGDALRIYDR